MAIFNSYVSLPEGTSHTMLCCGGGGNSGHPSRWWMLQTPLEWKRNARSWHCSCPSTRVQWCFPKSDPGTETAVSFFFSSPRTRWCSFLPMVVDETTSELLLLLNLNRGSVAILVEVLCLGLGRRTWNCLDAWYHLVWQHLVWQHLAWQHLVWQHGASLCQWQWYNLYNWDNFFLLGAVLKISQNDVTDVTGKTPRYWSIWERHFP